MSQKSRRQRAGALEPAVRGLRVAVYSHDTYGLGHLTRSVRLARGVVEAFPGSSVLILSGSPIAHRFAFPPGVDYVKLPSVVKSGPDTYVARDLSISKRDIRRMRAQLIADAVGHFRPHVLLVDNVPLGMKGELLPTLKRLKRHRPDTAIHLNLRDILDEPDVIRAAWTANGTYEALGTLYDEVHVFGCRSIFDSVAAYGLPEEKTAFLGYVAPLSVNGTEVTPLPPAEPGRARVLVTIGGGGDGAEILRAVVELQRSLGKASPYQFHVITGPLMDAETQRELTQKLIDVTGVTSHTYVEGLPTWMAQCDLVLSMGGYNTLCEVLAVARRSVVVPRVYPRREQEMRARAFEARELLDVLLPQDVSAESIDALLQRSLNARPKLECGRRPPLSGIRRLQVRLRAALGQRGRGARAAGGPRSRPGWRHGRTVAGALLAFLIPFGIPRADVDLVPTRVEASLRVGYDSNLLNASDAERVAFDQDAPDALFVVNRMQDTYWLAGLSGEWGLGRVAGMKSKLRVRYERIQFTYNPIKSEDSYGLGVQVRPSASTRVVLDGRYRPQVYGRHREDKDALPGAPVYRAEVHERWDLSLGIRTLARQWVLSAEAEGSWRGYNQPFHERDRRRGSLMAGASRLGIRGLVPTLRVSYRRSRSRNEPDLGKDLSYREWILDPSLGVTAFARLAVLDGAVRMAWRRYTSDDPEDWNHWGRDDFFGEARLRFSRAVSSSITADLAYAYRWRTAHLDSDQSIDYDEEGSFSEYIYSGGLTYVWEP